MEGTGGHPAKDRLQRAGMRWTQPGARALLDLGVGRLNGDWDAYGQFQRQRQHQRRYGITTPRPAAVEGQGLEPAA
ncbi:MAG: hypothetical protein M3Q65_26240 [Chloroflexota bacterium]|nr:hypothetical protein [Chloroflexota bacterium]